MKNQPEKFTTVSLTNTFFLERQLPETGTKETLVL